MGKTELKIEDLTKAELLCLIRSGYVLASPRDLLWIRHDSITLKAYKLSGEALKEMKNAHGIENLDKWHAASKKFDRAMRLYDKADRLIDRIGD